MHWHQDAQRYVIPFILIITLISVSGFFYTVSALSPSFSRNIALDSHPDEIDNVRASNRTTENYVKYYDPLSRYSVEYPTSWMIAREGDNQIDILSAKDRFLNFLAGKGANLVDTIGFYSPPEGDSDTFKEQMLVNIHPTNKSLEDLALEIFDGLRYLPDMKILSIDRRGNPYRLSLEYQAQGSRVQEDILLTQINGFPAVFSLLREKKELDYVPIMNHMIESVQTYASTTDIKKVTYFSNGKSFDATLWLAAPLNWNNLDNMTFGMLLDTDLNQIPDYQVEIAGSKNGTMSKTISEFEPVSSLSAVAEKRILDERSNYSAVFENGRRFIDLTTDLDGMGSPTRYKVLFYTIGRSGQNNTVADFTNWINVPPPEVSMNTKPNPISLRQGQNSTVYLTINATTGFKPTVQLSAENQTITEGNHQVIDYNFEQHEDPLSHFGTVTVPLHLNTHANTSAKKYTLPLLLNMTFPPEFVPQEFENRSESTAASLNEDSNFTIPATVGSENVVELSNLEIVVDPSIPVEDQILEFLNKFQFPITFISGILAGHIFPWLFKKWRKQSKDQVSKNSSREV